MLPDDAASFACVRCGRFLTGQDTDEDPGGDQGHPLCGECARERDFIDFEIEVQEADRDDEIDG